MSTTHEPVPAADVLAAQKRQARRERMRARRQKAALDIGCILFLVASIWLLVNLTADVIDERIACQTVASGCATEGI